MEPGEAALQVRPLRAAVFVLRGVGSFATKFGCWHHSMLKQIDLDLPSIRYHNGEMVGSDGGGASEDENES